MNYNYKIFEEANKEKGDNRKFGAFTIVKEKCGIFINDDRTQNIILTFIIINSAMMGVSTYEFVRKFPQVQHYFDLADETFLTIFSIELGLQFIYHGVDLFLDEWLVFDFIIISLSWIFHQIQSFRILRALRILGKIEAMSVILKAIFLVGPKISSIIIMLLIVHYIFSVFFTEYLKDFKGLTTVDYFSRLDKTIFTLFQIMTLDDYETIFNEVMVNFPLSWIPFMIFIIMSSFTMVNAVVAVFISTVDKARLDEANKKNSQKKIQNIDSFLSVNSNDIQENIDFKIDKVTEEVQRISKLQEQTFDTINHMFQKAKLAQLRSRDIV